MKKYVVLFLVSIAFVGCNKKPAQPATTKTSIEVRLKQAEEATLKTPQFDNYIGLGLLYIEAKQHPKALEAFKKAYMISPNAIAANNVCSELNEMGRALLAKKWCEKSLALEPKFVMAKNNLALSVAKIANVEKQIAALKVDKKLTPQQKTIELGFRSYQLGDFESALAIWLKDQDTTKERWIVLNNIASAYLELNKLTEAEKYLNEASRLNPNDQLIKNNMVWLKSSKEAKVTLPLVP